ncbi:hypothetical protein IPA_01865 [Ignicoccus pacificus DSM 13166]|uniref:Uncharacterized protein n=1 Tax=Ignicoccus pacificus DSM 13166 TaxID=940294 RepID=A0A977KAL4_9CREN|nr:hypothetical protein IPA_01865 [Ignicoccus pacificus DSM 13166]
MEELEVLESLEEEVEEGLEEADELVEEVEETVERLRALSEAEEEPPPPGYLKSLASWLNKLVELKKVLEDELEKSKGLEAMAIAEEIMEVKREIAYTRWKISEGLERYRAYCDRNCSACPLELLCKNFPSKVNKSKGAKEPWLIATLMHKYRLL